MKSAYEKAMERLEAQAPRPPLSEEQKKEIAEIDSQYKAKLAEREVFLKGKLAEAEMNGDYEQVQQLEKQLISDRKSMENEAEEAKEKVRNRSQES